MACGSGSSCSMCYFDLVMVMVKGYLFTVLYSTVPYCGCERLLYRISALL